MVKVKPLSTRDFSILCVCLFGISQAALKTSAFRDEDACIRMDFVLATAKEFCAAIAYLHSMDVVHGDLKSTNVLLKSAAKTKYDQRGFTAKASRWRWCKFCQSLLSMRFNHAALCSLHVS